jgi:hypothetical protein
MIRDNGIVAPTRVRLKPGVAAVDAIRVLREQIQAATLPRDRREKLDVAARERRDSDDGGQDSPRVATAQAEEPGAGSFTSCLLGPAGQISGRT